jgi:hypothetical protein
VAQVKRYELLLSELAIHPRMPLDRLNTVSTEPDVTDEIGFLNHFRSSHDRQLGSARVVSTKVVSVHLGQSAAKSNRSTVHVTACLDVSGVRAIGRDGKSIVPRSRKPFYVAHLQLVKVGFKGRETWLVSKAAATEEQSCGA